MIATITRWVAIALVGTAAASIAALFAAFGWPFELFAHFRWQLCAAALALLLVSIALRRRWIIALALVPLAVQWLPYLWPGMSSAARRDLGPGVRVTNASPAAPTVACSGGQLRIVTANVWFASEEHAPMVAWLDRSDADVIALQEVTPAWDASLETLAEKYPYQKVLARTDPYGIALLSRWPVVGDVQIMDFAGDGLPSLVAALAMRGQTVQVIAMHTRWPVLPDLLPLRDRALQRAAALASASPASTVLLGDINLTPYAPAFARLLEKSRLRDALSDEAWRPTWLAGFWPLALPIDHVLVPRDSCVIAHEIGPYVGSDHRPLQVTLQLR